MIRSFHDENPNEFEVIRDDDHVGIVAERMKSGLATYFAKLLARAPISEIALKLSMKFKVEAEPADAGDYLKTCLNTAVARFEKDRAPYVQLFQPSHMDSYRENASTFRSRLVTKCPVIQKTLYSKREELHDWKVRFGKADSQELADIFANLIDFESSYADSVDRRTFAKFNSAGDFEFGQVEEEDYSVEGVIGMGIKSAVLYHLEPALFPRRSRMDLYALYFLTGRETFGMPSDSSEFLMVNDHIEVTNQNLKVEHNYWYPYDLFSLYEMRLFRWLNTECKKHGVSLDSDYRYVYVAAFNDHVCQAENEFVQVMMGGGQRDGLNFYL